MAMDIGQLATLVIAIANVVALFFVVMQVQWARKIQQQSAAREFGPQNIHVAHLVIDAGVDTAWVRARRRERTGSDAVEPGELMNPASIAATYWQLHQQPPDAWTHELDLRPHRERW